MTLGEQVAALETEVQRLREREAMLRSTFVVNMLRSIPGCDKYAINAVFDAGFTEAGLATAYAAYIAENSQATPVDEARIPAAEAARIEAERAVLAAAVKLIDDDSTKDDARSLRLAVQALARLTAPGAGGK